MIRPLLTIAALLGGAALLAVAAFCEARTDPAQPGQAFVTSGFPAGQAERRP